MVRGRHEPHFGASRTETPLDEPRAPITRLSQEPPLPRGSLLGWWPWLTLCGLLAVNFAGWPLLREEAGGACQAVELRSLSIVLAGSVKQDRDNPMAGILADGFRRSSATGNVAAAIVRDRH